MTSRYCHFCGTSLKGPLEAHHIAGEVNDPLWTTDIHKGCHLLATAHQYARRMPLSKERLPPTDVQYQAMIDGLGAGFDIVCGYTGQSATSVLAHATVRRFLKHDPSPMIGRDYSDDGGYPKIKAKQPVRAPVGKICGENFYRTVSAMCSIIAEFVEYTLGDSDSLILLLRNLANMPPHKFPSYIPKSDLVIALATADESAIRESLADFANKMGMEV